MVGDDNCPFPLDRREQLLDWRPATCGKGRSLHDTRFQI